MVPWTGDIERHIYKSIEAAKIGVKDIYKDEQPDASDDEVNAFCETFFKDGYSAEIGRGNLYGELLKVEG